MVLHLKVVVKAKPEEKLTMTAEATGVKKITVTFNKAVDTTSKIVVKKASATPTISSTTFATDAKSAEIVMGTKLTAGTYTVEATVGEDKLTADIAVQDEKMSAFELVSKNLVADPDSTTKATISYKAVNQYGEMMAPGSVQATCSFGTVIDHGQATADKAGTVVVDDINTALAIVGTTGTLVLVDTTNGINLNETITYQSKAIPSAATIEGIYSEKTEKLVDGNLKAKSKVTYDYIMMNVQNQYGDDMNVEAIAKSKSDLNFNAASVLTNLTIAQDAIKSGVVAGGNFKDITYNGKTCILVKLAVIKADKTKDTSGEIDKAGTLNMTIVSSNKGVLASPSFTVDDSVVISSLSVSPADTVYANVENKLIVDAVDANGNAVTKYDDLKNAITSVTCNDGKIILKKNADGTGTYYLKPDSLPADKSAKYKNSTIKTMVFNVNDNTSSKYMVKTVNVTVYADQEAWKVAGVTSDLVTAVASGSTLTFDFSKLNYEDQYGNTVSYDKIKDLANSNVANIKYYLEDKDGAFGAAIWNETNKKLNIPSVKKGTATLYLQYKNSDVDAEDVMDSENYTKVYDIKVPISVVDVASVTASDLSVKVNDGKTICGIKEVTLYKETSNAAQATTDDTQITVVVTGKVGGKTVVIPTDNYVITGGQKLGNYGTISTKDNVAEKTEQKTVTVVVESEDGPQILSTEVTVSNANQKATEIKKSDVGNSVTISGSTATYDDLIKTIKVVDQYGITMSPAAKDVIYTVTVTGDYASDLKVVKSATQLVEIIREKITNTTGKYTASVKFEYGGVSFTQDVTLQF